MAAVAVRQETNTHDSLRGPLFIHKIQKISCWIERHGTARDGCAVDLERAGIQVHDVGPRRIKIGINTADAGRGISYPQMAEGLTRYRANSRALDNNSTQRSGHRIVGEVLRVWNSEILNCC